MRQTLACATNWASLKMFRPQNVFETKQNAAKCSIARVGPMLCSCMTNATTSLKRFHRRAPPYNVHAQIPISWWLKLPATITIHLKFAVGIGRRVVKMVGIESEMGRQYSVHRGYWELDAGDGDELNLILCAFCSSTGGAVWTMMVMGEMVRYTISTEPSQFHHKFYVSGCSGQRVQVVWLDDAASLLRKNGKQWDKGSGEYWHRKWVDTFSCALLCSPPSSASSCVILDGVEKRLDDETDL